MLEEGESERRHKRVTVQTLPGSSFEVIEFKLLSRLLICDQLCYASITLRKTLQDIPANRQ